MISSTTSQHLSFNDEKYLKLSNVDRKYPICAEPYMHQYIKENTQKTFTHYKSQIRGHFNLYFLLILSPDKPGVILP